MNPVSDAETVTVDEPLIKQAMLKDGWRMSWMGKKYFVLNSLIPLLMLLGF